MTEITPAEFWEDRYAATDQSWSGRVNAVLADIAGALAPGSALDLGCGEGGDVVWLADHGWAATGVDLSPTAVERGRAAARNRGLEAEFVAADLATWEPTVRFDLVTASFLQSPVELPREEVLRRAARWVAPGGHVLVTAHAAAPDWALPEHVRDVVFPTPQGDLRALDLDAAEWSVLVAEVRERDGHGPHGQTGRMLDGVVLARRA